MATAKKLPSGSWRCQVYSHTEKILQPDGTYKDKRIYKSFTCDDPSPKGKRKCEAEASAWAVTKERNKNLGLTFGKALDNYIEKRSGILSPGTIREYKRQRIRDYKDIENQELSKLTSDDVQVFINKVALDHSPKTVRNIYGLLTAVMDVYRPDFKLSVDLPAKVKPKLYIPTDEEVQRLLSAVEGTAMEIPVLLAAFGPLRRGEIAAINYDPITDDAIYVQYEYVKNDSKQWVLKAPKSYEGSRLVMLPEFVISKIKACNGDIVSLNPNQITHRFRSILDKLGLKNKFRFHDLRHYAASMLHLNNMPDSYIMERGGWSSDNTLKRVYRHVLEDKRVEVNQTANEQFLQLYNTKNNTNS